MREAISSNHFSHDQQLADAVEALTPEQRVAFLAMFPEWEQVQWSGSWVDTEAMGVDPEWSSWVTDWIEQNTDIYWEEGEPWVDGWLVDQSYGSTTPPEGWVCVQRDDEVGEFAGDLDAAVAYCQSEGGGRVLVIGDGEMMLPETDAMVLVNESGDGTVTTEWITPGEAVARGIISAELLDEPPNNESDATGI